MGVPKFYRWISERYPCLSEVVKEYQIPEFDTLYLDMNGIIHVCSHPEDDNPHFRITEEKIFTDVSYYIEFLFRMIKPRKSFFMAIDGVAPRAKMNQQRGRRFRSAREAEALEQKAREKGETLPTEKRFDSNCITPGTPFMARLQDYLKYFVVEKISTDPLWQSTQVYLSGHETPGEGEHKIMDYIRYQKSQPDYDPNTRHCLYGLDADLMMLGLVSHEPHFCLLREEVRFGGKRDHNKRPATPEETTFHLLHLSLMREYIDFEFSALKEPGKLSFAYDLERVIDDWVLMGFLVGNDFIPHLPHLHIHHDGLPLLWRTYMAILPTLDDYLSNGGHLNLPQFEKYLGELSKHDVDTFSEQFSDLKWLEGKAGKKYGPQGTQLAGRRNRPGHKKPPAKSGGNQFAVLVDLGAEEPDVNPTTAARVHADDLIDLNSQSESPDTEDDSDTFDTEFKMHKANYYMTKMNYTNVTQEVLRDQATEYVRAIQWILFYYYEGVPSWSWFYPHHYAPYMSDVRDFSSMNIVFDLSRPFLPFQQLMGVLPAASKDFLPLPYQKLMTAEDSPLVDFYPTDFKTDLNGKLQEWEAVVLIPFIEEKRLLKALQPIDQQLTDEEKARNRHGPHRLFEFSKEQLGEYASPCPDSFPDIAANRARCSEIPMFEFRIPSEKMRKGLSSGVRQDVYFPGFPTMKHITHKAELKKAGVKVFQMNSRGENMVVEIIQESRQLLDIVAQDRLGRSSFVGWPHLFEAKVVEISDGRTKYKLEETTGKNKGKTTPVIQDIKTETLAENEAAIWRREVGSIKEHYYEKRGIDVGNTSFLIRALPLMGRKYVCTSHGQITLEKQWAVRPVVFIHQATVKDITVHDSSYIQFTNLEDLFAPKTSVFMLGFPHYGCQGEVVDVDSKMEGRVRVSVTILQEPHLDAIKQKTHSLSMHYMPGYIVAQRLGISSHFLSRITGTIFVTRGSPDTHDENLARKVNVGLNLKFNKRSEEVPGYTKKVENQWTYSSKALDTMSQYLSRFPDMFGYITSRERAKDTDIYFESDVFEENGSENLKEVEDFIKTLPCSEVKPMKVGADILDELLIKEIEKEIDRVKLINKKKRKSVKMQVKPHLLFKPIFLHGGLTPDPAMVVELFDRVVNVREGFSVPFGLRGTVVGIHTGTTEADTMYEVLLDSEFLGGINLRCSPGRGYRCAANSIINLSYGERKEAGKHQPQSTTSNTSQWTATSSQGQENRGNNFSYVKATESRNDWTETSGSPREQTNRQYGNQNSNNRFNRTSFESDLESNPQFVTPRLNARPLPVKTNQSPGQRTCGQHAYTSKNENNSATNEFADIWKELQVSNMGSPQQPSGKSRSPFKGDLQADDRRQHSAFQTSKPKTVKDELNRKSAEMGDSQQLSHDLDNQSGSRTKIDLQSLFGQACSVSGVDKNSEFAAMMNSLEISGSLVDASASLIKSVLPGTSPESQNGSEAIKQMLQIQGEQSDRVSPSSPLSPRSPMVTTTTAPSHHYGKQVSIQELFEGAKQLSASAPTTGPPVVPPADSFTAPPPPLGKFTVPPPGVPNSATQSLLQTQSEAPQSSPSEPHQNPHAAADHSQSMHAGKSPRQPMNFGKSPRQQQHGNPVPRQPHPGVPPPALRNPVMELLDVSKSLCLGPPKYDYFTPQKGQIGAYVMLATGQKFQGSVCWTREEAAESAASMALLQLLSPLMPDTNTTVCKQAVKSAASMALLQLTKDRLAFTMMPPGVKPPPGIQTNPAMWSTGLLFSPHSAFSPVTPKAPPILGFPYQPHPHGSLSSAHHRPPPQYLYAAPWEMGSRPPGFQLQGHPGSGLRRHGAPTHEPPIYGGPPTHGPQNVPMTHLNLAVGVERANKQQESGAATISTPFIPLQVTKKQKTPQKLPPPSQRVPQEKGANSTAVADVVKGAGITNTSLGNAHSQQRSQRPESPKHEKGGKFSVQTPSDADGKKKQPKRARSRLAANFNFGPQ